jgi:hypothetical protein
LIGASNDDKPALLKETRDRVASTAMPRWPDEAGTPTSLLDETSIKPRIERIPETHVLCALTPGVLHGIKSSKGISSSHAAVPAGIKEDGSEFEHFSQSSSYKPTCAN